MKLPCFWFTLLFAVVLAAQAFAGQAPSRNAPGQKTPSQKSVEEAMRGYDGALCAGKPQAVAAWFTPDGQLLLPGTAPLRGRAAIVAFLAPMQTSASVQSVVTQSDMIAVHGQAADQWGDYREVAGPRGKAPKTYTGRYAALWHREGSHWRLFRLMMQPL